MAVLNFVGFGVLMHREMTSENPDAERIGAIGLRNAKLGGVRSVFQLATVVLMVNLRWGGFRDGWSQGFRPRQVRRPVRGGPTLAVPECLAPIASCTTLY